MYPDPPANNKRPLLSAILFLGFIIFFAVSIGYLTHALGTLGENIKLEKRYSYKVVVNPGLFEEFVYCDSIRNNYAYNDQGKVKLVGEYKVESIDKNKWK